MQTGKQVSRNIYEWLETTGKLGENQEQALIGMDLNGPCTSKELLRHMSRIGMIPYMDPNMVRPRLTELKKNGYVHVKQKRSCNASSHDKQVSEYALTDKGRNMLGKLAMQYRGGETQ